MPKYPRHWPVLFWLVVFWPLLLLFLPVRRWGGRTWGVRCCPLFGRGPGLPFERLPFDGLGVGKAGGCLWWG